MDLIAKGAEAELYLIQWFGLKAVLKWRKPKRYRDPQLDYQIRKRRTINEVRNMYIAHTAGIKVPAVYFFSPEDAHIIMEYIEGHNLRDVLDREYKRLVEVGVLVGRLHKTGLIHGDLALTNIILSRDDLYFIDFGLGELRKGWGRKTAAFYARDINVLLRSLDVYGQRAEKFKEMFWTGYREEMGSRADVVEREVSRIRASGRYVERRGVL